jgi:AraC-like DNA-binding protein
MWPKLQLIGHSAFFCIALSFLFFLFRYPDYFNKAQKQSREIRYRNSQLKNINEEKLAVMLDLLIYRDNIYRERNLTIKILSDKLKISSPQLSEFLSRHYKTNFNNLINSYRVKAVQKILNEKSDVNILEAAMDCGFNSKSTFNAAFRKFTGLTPSQYRAKKI